MGDIQIVDGHESCSNEFDVLRCVQARRPDAPRDLIPLNGGLMKEEFDYSSMLVRPDAAQTIFKKIRRQR